MFKTLLARARQGYRTAAYPGQDPDLPALFGGRPVLDPDKCVTGCTACVDVCPTGALRVTESGLELDIGRCIFCGDCAASCPEGAITFSRDWRLASSKRQGLVTTGDCPVQVDALSRELWRLLGRSLRLRQVSAPFVGELAFVSG
jgi:formate hydrogenlyase subunit 6/NADH:ubiquinone oxidoreductase subunit I